MSERCGFTLYRDGLGCNDDALDKGARDLLPSGAFSIDETFTDDFSEPLNCLRRNAAGPPFDLLPKCAKRLVHTVDFAAETLQALCDVRVARRQGAELDRIMKIRQSLPCGFDLSLALLDFPALAGAGFIGHVQNALQK